MSHVMWKATKCRHCGEGMILQTTPQLKRLQNQKIIHNMIKNFILISFMILSKTDVVAQKSEFESYTVRKDSIGVPFIKETLFLREVGMKEDNKALEIPYDRLPQYPFFILYSDSSNLFKNYEDGFFVFIDAVSPMKDSFNNRKIFFNDGIKLNSKFSLIKSIDTIYQSVKYVKKGYYKNVGKLSFEYEVYNLKLQVVYIGKYCYKVPYNFIRKDIPMFINKLLDVYIILDILQ